MLVDAIVLAGGRSSRLGGVPKAALQYRRRSLLEHAINAVGFARSIVVVGDIADAVSPDTLTADVFSADVLTAREEPAFGGPAAGIAAGLSRLRPGGTLSDFTFVLACDMPEVTAAVTALRAALATESDFDGLLATDGAGHPQPLAAVYRTSRLADVVEEQHRLGKVDGSSVFAMIAPLNLLPIAVPPGSTDDVDTWADASRFGITHPEKTEEP